MKSYCAALLLPLVILTGCATCKTPVEYAPEPVPVPVAAPAPVPTTAEAAPADAERVSMDELLRRAAAEPMKPFPGEDWNLLFDGQQLAPWQVVQYAGGGEVEVRDGLIVLGMGGPFTGIVLKQPPATMNYEITLDAMRVGGWDFFCGLTVPVGTNHCSLIVGGWGGGVLGISSFDGYDASENETTKWLEFDRGRWYRLRLRVTERKLEGWLDDQKVINVHTEDRRVSVRGGDIELCLPLGVASFSTTAAVRGLRWRAVSGPDSIR